MCDAVVAPEKINFLANLQKELSKLPTAASIMFLRIVVCAVCMSDFLHFYVVLNSMFRTVQTKSINTVLLASTTAQ